MKKIVGQGVLYISLLAGFVWDVPFAQGNGGTIAQVLHDEFHSSGSSACPPQVGQEERVARLERQYGAKAIYLSVAQAQEIYRRTGGKAFYTCGSDCDPKRVVCIKNPQYEAVIAQHSDGPKHDEFYSHGDPGPNRQPGLPPDEFYSHGDSGSNGQPGIPCRGTYTECFGHKPIPERQGGLPGASPTVPEACSLEDVAQAILDFNRGFMDSLTFGGTKALREAIYHDDGKILNQQAADVGTWTEVAATTIIPVPIGKVRLFYTFAQYAKGTVLSVAAARWIVGNGKIVWAISPWIRGNVIERVLATLQYTPINGYRWTGVLHQGKFRLVDFINEAAKEQVSLKTVFRSNPQGWRNAELTLQEDIRKLGSVNKIWIEWVGNVKVRRRPLYAEDLQNSAPECVAAAAQWKRVLDIRVPPGYENELKGLIEYAKQFPGVEVRISAWP